MYGSGTGSEDMLLAQVLRNCAVCHSLEAGRHITGPSPEGAYERKAASAEDFERYSDALKRSAVTWTEEYLDKWPIRSGSFPATA